MFDPFFDMSHAEFGSGPSLGHEFLLTANDHLVSVNSTFGGGSGATSGAASGGVSPASTLVGNAHGLEINLIWDSSVTSNVHWASIEASVVAAAKILTGLFTNHDVLNIAVGFGEVAGSALAPGALGESASFGYITDEPTVEGALGAADAGLVHAGLMSANAVSALQGLSGENFFVTSAEAKALGLVDPAAGLDGFIGLSSTAPFSFGGFAPKGSFDAVAVAAHEISEVMGRVGLEGATLGPFANVYTPLDVFRYSAPGAPDVTPTAGYFSLNDGATNLLPFNDPSNGGDAADWATAAVTRGNAFNAFASPGPAYVTPVDLLEMAALGYQVGGHH
ncbi:MAG TPA: NF038122 family metalloprotease [Caulobacteraceae bacterium]|nr:NF038122 family metalloprotease [Caulobacteraceae bacterium]